MKIYIGNINIASLYDELRFGFEALGHSVVTVQESGHAITSGADYTLSDLFQEEVQAVEKKLSRLTPERREQHLQDLLRKVHLSAFSEACNADLAIFICRSFLPDWQDLSILKNHGIKTVACYAGSEARVLPLENFWRARTGSSPAVSAAGDMESVLRHVRFAELHADALIGGTVSGLRPMYMPLTTILRTDSIPHRVSDRDEPIILHAPSRRLTKGTDIWLRIFSELEDEGFKFSVRLLENIPHKGMLDVMQHMDIFCDGLFHGGKMAREAMAAGCVALSAFGCDREASRKFWQEDDRILREQWQVEPGSVEDAVINDQFIKKTWYFDKDINPCIPVTPETAKDRLRELLNNKSLRKSLALRGRPTMEKHCDPVEVCKDIMELAFNPDSFKAAAMQSWHRSVLYYDYFPASAEEAAIFNSTTDIVRECPWYKKAYRPLQRGGLLF